MPYLNGARREAPYRVSIAVAGQALNVTCVSYDGKLNIGFTGCRDSLPHLQRLAVYAGEALDELQAALDEQPVCLDEHLAAKGQPRGSTAVAQAASVMSQ